MEPRTTLLSSLKVILTKGAAGLCLLALVASCVPSQSGGGGGKRSRGGSTNNETFTVSPNFGRYLDDNPIAISGDTALETGVDLSIYINPTPRFITSNQFLIAPCEAGGSTVTSCLEVREDESSNYISATENRWAFDTSTQEFLQVQAFANMRDIQVKFHENLEFSYSLAQGYGYSSAIPFELFSSDDNAYWFKDGILKGYSNCGEENNAFYDPAGNTICLGHITVTPSLYVAEDPTVTWHEMGHAFAKVNMNMRHRAFEASIEEDSNLGYLFYDEAGSINEGLADFYSLFMNDRTLFAEWALGRYLVQARPLSEAESIHAPGVSETTEGRLSYPTYVTYDPNEPDVPFEDVHYAGQIPSHFFTAFYKSLQDSSVCGLSSDLALKMTMHLIFETLSELGDQTATGSGTLTTNPANYTVNLDPTNAVEWMSKNNPINFRRFFQTFSKYFMRTLGNSSFAICNGREYYQDDYEKLLDSYGLLLFKTYNENGGNMTTGHSGTNITVTPTNRVKSQLIKKDLLVLDNRENSATAFVIDGQADIRNAIESLILGGRIPSISSQIDGNFAFNNGNAQISPGEVVGVAVNLLNTSNSTMAGVHLLANDWDHVKGGAPCNNLGDNFPLDSEGAADLTTGEGSQGGCDYITRYNGTNAFLEPNEELAPVCLVEFAEESSTQWVTQDKLRKKLGLAKSNCLGGEDSLRDCFIRSIKGADHAYYSKIEPQQTWAESLQNSEGVPTFNTSNVVFFEVSPWIPPGTTFNCRMRASFSNCEDCYHDEDNADDDYLDFEFAGAKPFKIINFKFTVID
jgi:hypothetical protein